ncbi:MAG: radical SAM protein [Planctomycetes bacterium]|nr:radical SAM protein [Planctomycetota bacterium]
MSMIVEAPGIDRARMRAAIAAALEPDVILDRWQRANVWAKAEDLLERRMRWSSLPFRLMVEFNRRCNTHCRMCPIQHSPTEELSPTSFERVLDEMGPGVMEVVPFLSGEPTLAPLPEVAAILRPRNIFFSLTTNGERLDAALWRGIEDVTARVNVSLQSHRRDLQEQLVPGLSFDRIVENLRRLAQRSADAGFDLASSCVVMHANARELSAHAEFLAELGVRRWIVQRLYPWGPYHAEEGRSRSIDDVEEVDLVAAAVERAAALGMRVESNFGRGVPALSGPDLPTRFRSLDEQRFLVDLVRPGFCASLASTAVLTATGQLRPCCRHPIDLGPFEQLGFLSLWNGPAMQTLRREHFDRSLRPACRACTAYYAEEMPRGASA